MLVTDGPGALYADFSSWSGFDARAIGTEVANHLLVLASRIGILRGFGSIGIPAWVLFLLVTGLKGALVARRLTRQGTIPWRLKSALIPFS